jgi:hypothetical protein
MKRIWLMVAVFAASLLLPASALAKAPPFTARISAPPQVQRVGNGYLVTVTIKHSAWIPKFCINFGDDNNSWKIILPGLQPYNNDAFCMIAWGGTLRRKSNQFTARIIAAKQGQKKLEICLGHAQTIDKGTNNVILDDNSLCWSDSFVLVG